MVSRSGSLNLSLALNVLSKTARVSRLRILRRTRVWPPRAVGVEISTSRQRKGAFSNSKNILRFTSMASIKAAMVSSEAGLASGSVSGTEDLYQSVEKLLAFVEGCDEEALIAAVEADVVAVHKEVLDTVSGDSGGAELGSVGGVRDHDGDDRNAWPLLLGRLGNGGDDLGIERRCGSFVHLAEDGD